MKYSSLTKDIVDILHSSDYDFKLRFYDSEGTSTLDTENIKWCYITNKNIMIELMDDETPEIYLWKDRTSASKTITEVIQRIREMAVLNGISVQVRLYDNLDQRKIYNIIKGEMEMKQNSEVDESFNTLFKTIHNTMNVANNTKRPSDFYLSEEMQRTNSRSLLKMIVESLCKYDSFNNSECRKFFKSLEEAFDIKDLKVKLKSLKQKHSSAFDTLVEHVSDIKNITNFNKNRYLKNNNTETHNTFLVLENVQAYRVKTQTNKDNLIKAYNHLISVCENAKTGTDILRQIKKYKLCETYNITKNELLDMWLSKAIDSEIKPQYAIVIENVIGDKTTLNIDMVSGIKPIMEYLNNGGKDTDETFGLILEEVNKFNALTDLIKNYSNNTQLKPDIAIIKHIYKECYNKLNKPLSESEYNNDDSFLNNSVELNKLQQIYGFKHPALKYIATEKLINSLDESCEKSRLELIDYKKLFEVFKLTNSTNVAKEISLSIIENKLVKTRAITESVNNGNDALKVAKQLYNNIYSSNGYTENINDTLYTIIKSKKLNESKVKFVKTLQKYLLD